MDFFFIASVISHDVSGHCLGICYTKDHIQVHCIPGKVDEYKCSVSSSLDTGISRLDNDLELAWFFPVFCLEIMV